ncbi:TrbI/VirB10 family protein [Perlucidibaca piscinae]|uniref:TrbI/VirB10 family protein n=1 Tax=Perlucidibaca piscinae TaxID=392589 RepID=UPI00047A5A15|nr:TrbI/VirB10 family protein [Perlucidibaca piscinae]
MTTASEPLPPKVDPDSLALRAQPSPVKRLNRKVLIAGAGTVSLGLLGVTVWSLQPVTRSASEAPAELHNVERVARAETLDALPQEYSQMPHPAALPPEVPVLGEPLPGDLAKPMLDAQRAGTYTPTYQGGSPGAASGQAAASHEEVAKSPLFFRSNSSGPVRGASDVAAGLAPIVGGDIAAAGITTVQGSAGATDPTVGQNQQASKQAFVDTAESRDSVNPSSLKLPASPYQVMAGTLIPAALITGLKSDLPGQVIASTTEPVYDTATGRHLLIPQGSRLIGRYDSQVTFGQRRVLLVWQRVILPDTSSIALDRLPGVDTAGYAGLEDGVDWHWDRILAGAALSTLIGVGAELAAPTRDGADGRVVVATRESVQETINTVGQELTRRNLNIQPTLTIRPGFPVRVMVNKDLVLRPYQPLFFTRGLPQ